MRFFVQLSRYLIGIWLLLSGVLMLDDPIAFANKIEVYFSVLHLNFLQSIDIYCGMIIGAITMLLGLSLLLGSFIQITSWCVAVYALIATCLTGYVSINRLIVEMPSFGEILHWSPITAFYRDIFVLVLSAFLLLGKNQIDTVGGFKWNVFFFILATLSVIALPYFTFTHGAFYSKLPMKKGLDLRQKWAIPAGAPRDSFATYFYYYNLKKQQLDSFGADKIGEHLKDLANKKKYLFEKSASILVRKGVQASEPGFSLLDAYGRSIQDSILNVNGLSLWVVFRQTITLNEMEQRKLRLAIKSAEDNKLPLLGISKLKVLESDKVRHDNNWSIPFVECPSDEIIRQLCPQSPSFILMHNGKVEQIWSFSNLPNDFSHF